MERYPPAGGNQRPLDPSRSQRNTPQSTPHLPAFLPPAAQQPVQIPFSDPFHHQRDPFLPGQQHRRIDGYGTAPGGPPPAGFAGEKAWPNTLGHQAPPSQMQQQNPYVNGHHPSQSSHFDHARRRSVGGSGSPKRFYGGRLDPPPPPPSYTARHMLPPSPPTQRGAPSASPYGGSRDLPGFGARPGGLSISSLIGGDGNSRSEQPSRAETAHNSPTFRSVHTMSPPLARSSSARSEQAYNQGPSSPRHSDPTYGYEPRRVPVHYESGYHLPPQPHSASAVFPPSHAQPFRMFQSSPMSTSGEPGQQNGVYAPPRPNSQPTNMQGTEEAWNIPAGPDNARFSGFRGLHGDRGVPHEQHQLQEAIDGSKRIKREDNRNETSPDSLPKATDRPEPHVAGVHLVSHVGASRGSFLPTRSEHMPVDGTSGFRDARGFPQGNGIDARRDQQSSPLHSETYRRNGFLGTYSISEKSARDVMERGPRRETDDGPAAHRSLLTVSPDVSKKNGRSSPLPQAVQGAQPRQIGPGRDSSIKNEFGRMFSGLGSGVGGSSTPVGGQSANGNVTPSRISPSNQSDAVDPEAQHDEGTLTKNRRRAREQLVKEDVDSVGGRETPTSNNNGKRARTGPVARHHHHHTHPHHHHHHHHAVPEEQQPTPGGSFSTLRFPSNGPVTQNPTSAHFHHHHHHHHHPNHARAVHHHHHTLRGQASGLSSVSVKSEALLQIVARKPRQHLGSALYARHISEASNKHNVLQTESSFQSTPIPLPRFEGKENCTFTIRVPRSYIATTEHEGYGADRIAGGLEDVCKRRALWGTGVYTDDSDVVAAAVHSGWIKGDFGEANEDLEQMTTPAIDSTTNTQPSETRKKNKNNVLDQVPSNPVAVPADMDLHINVLILPPLECYASTWMHNLQSRAWAGDHDGMSFMIQSVEFVDEPRFTRYLERGNEARRQRIGEENRSRREAAESLLGLMSSGGGGGGRRQGRGRGRGHGLGLGQIVAESGRNVAVGA